MILWSAPLPLGFGREGSLAYFREFAGHDEMAIEGGGALAGSRLLERLLVDVPGGALVPAGVWDLPLHVRDRLMAFVHMRLFGDRVESVARCRRCEKPFEVSFSLSNLVQTQQAPRSSPVRIEGPDADGTFAIEGLRFRLPTAGDERAVAGLSPADAGRTLFERCVVSSLRAETDAALVQTAMQDVAPMLDLDLDGRCPHCETMQPVHFDVVAFCLAAIQKERPLLLREVHRIAATYHWSSNEILELPRSVRRAYVGLIEAERRRLVA